MPMSFLLKTPKILFVIFLLLLLSSCNKDGMDTSELWEKANTSGEIIRRSGTIFNSGTNKEVALNDAENRLRTGGGLFGKKSGISFFNSEEEDKNASIGRIGIPINPYLWQGALETISFMPLASADPFSGIIITDWYSYGTKLKERCKLNIFIKGIKLKTSNLRVNSFCQKNNENLWQDIPTDIKTNTSLENAILNKAKKIKLKQG